MEITSVRIRKVNGEGRLRAWVSVTFDDSFVVHNMKIIEGDSGLFLAMPSRRNDRGEYKDIAHPINSDFREKLQRAVFEAYEREE